MTYVAFVLMILWTAAFGLFAAGYALEDPGGVPGALMVAVPAAVVVLLALLALWRPTWASPVFVVLVAAVLAVAVLDTFRLGFDRNVVGPVGAVSDLVVAAGLAFLGLRRSKLAGLLLVVLSLGTFGILMARTVGAGPDRPPLSAILTGSSGVGLVPMLVIGVLFLVAGFLLHEGRDDVLPTSGGSPSGTTGRHHRSTRRQATRPRHPAAP
ncbi:MAG TPA: hypothetical protein VFK68_05945 [Propionibacteriaceae bacterium]|nr:hypothetical protein [Propionibacteriaceae bacterium]